ncbi:hypothetical protein A1O1_00463 [Capronia coronata CBS 617.96]|uniref:Phytanoyl-CoA dioxygenase n=1 Tax=Capronia coronata CBS 617.96 TaxID=1182541 RepID=W9YS55_9EURO|nr:uncharacterized protein A1O1_00463 [Capronia coronata CBS 617.96]EXJ95343.1 hypothetical protein A1O1_00463 [Capronia coronata CBS 617.96]
MATITETPKTQTYKVKPTPPIPVVDGPTTTPEEVVEALKVAGGCIVRRAVPVEIVDQVEKDIRPALDQDTPWVGSFFPANTKRCYGVLGKSDAACEVVLNPLFQAVASMLLTDANWFWEGTEKRWAVSKPQLMNTTVFSIGPGATAQPLHRDDGIHHRIPKAIDSYPADLKRDTSLGFLVAGKKATKENGATRFIPGSHLWAHEQPPDESLCQYAELEKGDAFFMLSGVFHGGSANHTTDEERLIFANFMTRGWLRQEENQYLTYEKEVMQRLPVEIQKLVGYSLSEPFLGWVNAADPRIVLDPNVERNMDIFSSSEIPVDV